MVNRYVLAEDFKCKYCGSMASTRTARDFTAVIVSESSLATLPCPKCEALLTTSAMPYIRILAVCLLMKSDRTSSNSTITAHRQARYTDG